ncbi:MAG: hypothetical protein V4448_12890 [Pseudomonadota bacterium]|uniref:ParD-like antitoxin of type II toxin-antitoxin system n=1 Tax=Polaromonas aquatica TaxID=332657 RepID=A0ABW1TUU9_9BURK
MKQLFKHHRLQKVSLITKMQPIKGVRAMAVAMKLSDELVEDARTVAAAEHRSVPKQIEYWARIGKAVLDNPDIPLRMIQDTMLSLEEVKAGQASVYKFG